MDKQTISFVLAALVVGGVSVLGVQSITVKPDKPAVISQQDVKSDVLKTATKDCLVLVAETCGGKDCECHQGEWQDGTTCTRDITSTDKGGKEYVSVPGVCPVVQGWICNGAPQPQRVQDCLNAATKAEVDPELIDVGKDVEVVK